MRFSTLFASIISVFAIIASAHAQEPQKAPPLKFGTTEGSPFVYKTATGEWTGFDIDLAQAVCQEMNVPCSFVNYDSFPGLLQSVQQKQTDAAIGSISITSERAKNMDFSTPYFNSGLMIMTREQNDSSFSGKLEAFWTTDLPFYGKTLAPVIFIFFGIMIIFVFAIAKWNGMTFEEAFWSVTQSVPSASGKNASKTSHILVLALSVVFAGIFVAQLTSAITAHHFEYNISMPKDLRGKDVATVDGTTSVALLREKGAKTHLVTDINDAYKMLEAGQVDAIVYDAPTLQFYSKTDGAGKVAAVGSVFAQQDYGIALPEGSDLRARINQAILKVKENGVYDRIYQKYFGVE